jgi:phenylalanine-4-hydroxylase
MSRTDPYVLEPAPFSAEATRNWARIMRAHVAFLTELRDRIHPSYLRGFRQLDLDPFDVPRLPDLNRRLAAIGWEAVCVDGYVPTSVYAAFLTRRVFPVAAFLRGAAHLEHSPAPDLAHDLLGHLPLLFCPEHRAYLQRLASVMTGALDNEAGRALYRANRKMSTLLGQGAPPVQIALAEAEAEAARRAAEAEPSEMTELSRIFLWSIEFGLVGRPGQHQLLGAGLMSSPREARLACQPSTPVAPYDLQVVHHEIEFSDPQCGYFVAAGYPDMHDVLDRYIARREEGRHAPAHA